MMVHKTLHESLQLAAWLKAHAKHMPMSPEENKMQRAALVMSDMYKQNKILRELLDLNRQEPHDAK